jgi:hypothetical protein
VISAGHQRLQIRTSRPSVDDRKSAIRPTDPFAVATRNVRFTTPDLAADFEPSFALREAAVGFGAAETERLGRQSIADNQKYGLSSPDEQSCASAGFDRPLWRSAPDKGARKNLLARSRVTH